MSLMTDHKQLSMIACLEIYHRIKSSNHTLRMPGAPHVSFEVQLYLIHYQLVPFVILGSRTYHRYHFEEIQSGY